MKVDVEREEGHPMTTRTMSTPTVARGVSLGEPRPSEQESLIVSGVHCPLLSLLTIMEDGL